jgi:hypothetical protein
VMLESTSKLEARDKELKARTLKHFD